MSKITERIVDVLLWPLYVLIGFVQEKGKKRMLAKGYILCLQCDRWIKDNELVTDEINPVFHNCPHCGRCPDAGCN